MRPSLPTLLILGLPGLVLADSPGLLFSWGCNGTRSPNCHTCQDQAPGQLNAPNSVVVATDGSVWVAESRDCWPESGRLSHFAANGAPMGAWPLPERALKLAAAPDGTVYCHAGQVAFRFQPDGQLVTQGGVGAVVDIAVAPSGEVLGILGSYVFRYTADLELLGWFGGSDLLTPGHLPSPFAIACDGEGRIYVMDRYRSLQVFDPAGNLLWAWPSIFEGGTGFDGRGMCLEPEGSVLIADSGITRVSASGEVLSHWTVPVVSARVSDVARSADGVIYVPEVRSGRVYAFGTHTVIRTDPQLLPVIVDGVERLAPYWADWPEGSVHELEATALFGSGDVRSGFDTWADEPSRIRTVIAGDSPASFDARYVPAYRLTVRTGAGVEVDPPEGWMLEGRPFPLQATLTAPGADVHWVGTGPGSFTGSASAAVLVPQGVITEEVYRAQDADQAVYDFSLSGSGTDPLANAVVPVEGIRSVYLWMTCGPEGLATLEAGVSGTLIPLGFEPMNGVLSAGTATDLRLAVPACPTGLQAAFVLGRWTFWEPPGGGTFCLAPSAGGAISASDCDPVQPMITRGVGFRGFDSAGGVPCVSATHSCGLPELTTAVHDTGAEGGLLAVFPNPFRDETDLHFSTARDGRVRLSVYDVAGRLVSRLHDGDMVAGSYRVSWDGLDSTGRPSGPGIYFALLESDGTRHARKVVRAR